MSSSQKAPIKRTIAQEQMELYEKHDIFSSFTAEEQMELYKKHTKFYFKKVSIISKMIEKEYGLGEGDKSTLTTLTVKPLRFMREFDVGLGFKWSKGRTAVIHISLEMKWKDTKRIIDNAMIKLRNWLEGKVERCCVCYEDQTAKQDNYSCACCNTTLCMCCVNKIRKDKPHFKCPVCRSMNNCSHML